ncbi:MAG: DUF262 domain-containing protein [Bacteroidales bacterium]|jgi:hypothetical protein|nr:DUF262 domain-containing protein [Bacteroidales bacterium]
MKITLKEVSIRELTEGYVDNQEEGVKGFGGKLDIRPPYQREFVYKDKQRNAVIHTIKQNFPLNVMYWAINGDGTYEIIDGQQRTISICQYVTGVFSFDLFYFHSLQNDEQEKILNYKLMVYLCEGTDSEKLEWFKTINIAGEKLTEQELRNAVYHGSFVNDAKRYFSKSNCAAYGLGKDYLNGSAIRQDYLETAISWINNGNIEAYMTKHQHEPNALTLWNYFQSVITWVKGVFTKYRKEMKGVDWGSLYNKYKDNVYNAAEIEKKVAELMIDDDVTNKKGIYTYILTGEEKNLNIRAFSEQQKRKAYEQQKGICVHCKEYFDITEMQADHIIPWSKGGKTNDNNCQLLCQMCNATKSNK